MSRGGMSLVLVLGLLASACASSTQTGSIDSSTSSASPSPPASHHGAAMSVAGSTQRLTVELPAGWENGDVVAASGTSDTAAGTVFFLTVVENTFEDPCALVERVPNVGSSVQALATALGEIPDTTSAAPARVSIAGHEATYVELTGPTPLPCQPDEQFCLFAESTSDACSWWLTDAGEQLRVWILEVAGDRVVIAARSWPDTSEVAMDELLRILDTIRFDAAS